MSEYRNRVLGFGQVQAGQLCANPANWRIHPHYQQQALAASLDEVGWVSPVIVNANSGNVVDGHLRVLVALERAEEQELPVAYVDLTDDEERLMLATLDPMSAMAVTDKAKLAGLLNSINVEHETLHDLLEATAKRNRLKLNQVTGAVAEPSAQPRPCLCVCPQCGNSHYEIIEPKGTVDGQEKSDSEG